MTRVSPEGEQGVALDGRLRRLSSTMNERGIKAAEFFRSYELGSMTRIGVVRNTGGFPMSRSRMTCAMTIAVLAGLAVHMTAGAPQSQEKTSVPKVFCEARLRPLIPPQSELDSLFSITTTGKGAFSERLGGIIALAVHPTIKQVMMPIGG